MGKCEEILKKSQITLFLEVCLMKKCDPCKKDYKKQNKEYLSSDEGLSCAFLNMIF